MEENIVRIPVDGKEIEGALVIPEGTTSLVLFSHGSGSSRFSPRNNFVARVLNDAGMGTFLMDLLTEEEDSIYQTRFNIELLTERLQKVTEWVKNDPKTKDLAIGYFGSSTGAASALIAAAELGEKISAVVSRGGRSDLAADSLPSVQSPTLLIVGGNDHGVIELNEQAFDLLTCEKKLEIVPGATHLFEEEGKLEEVAELAKNWFQSHFNTP